jgi:hypothetical protein
MVWFGNAFVLSNVLTVVRLLDQGYDINYKDNDLIILFMNYMLLFNINI